MKRRTFVRSAALGAFGLGLNPVLKPLHLFQSEGVQHWLRSLVSAAAARRRSDASVGVESFGQLTRSLNTYFAERGYTAEHSGFYFYGDSGSCCFYPLKLRRSAAGLSDLLVPVLTLQADGSWRHIHTLTGYEIEALALAAKNLADYPGPLHRLLLPAPGRPANFVYSGFSSQEADVSISTRLQGGKADTKISISDKDHIIFSTTFTSRHCLTLDTAKV